MKNAVKSQTKRNGNNISNGYFSASIEFFSPFDLIADWITIKFLQETNNVFSNEVCKKFLKFMFAVSIFQNHINVENCC